MQISYRWTGRYEWPPSVCLFLNLVAHANCISHLPLQYFQMSSVPTWPSFLLGIAICTAISSCTNVFHSGATAKVLSRETVLMFMLFRAACTLQTHVHDVSWCSSSPISINIGLPVLCKPANEIRQFSVGPAYLEKYPFSSLLCRCFYPISL